MDTAAIAEVRTISDSPPSSAAPLATPPPSPSDTVLLSEIARGKLARFDVFVDHYKHRLLGFILQRVRDRHAAEDIAQEVFLRVFRAVDGRGYNGEASVATWLFTIANNCATDHLRTARRRPESVGEPGERIDPDPGPAERASRAESDCRTRDLLACLPDAQREVVALKIFGGLTFAEIAEVLACPLPTVKSRMSYGLQKIRQLLQDPGNQP